MNCGFWKKKPTTDVQPEHKRVGTQIEWRFLNGQSMWTTRNLTWLESRKTQQITSYHASWRGDKITVQEIKQEVSESRERNVGINLDGIPVVDFDKLNFNLPNQPMAQLIR